MNTHSDQHPHEDDLLEFVSGLRTDPAIEAHVRACAPCRARAGRWEFSLDDLGQALRAEADRQFPDSELARARAAIGRRLRGAPRARVLHFPIAPLTQPGRHRLPGAEARRWVAAAALAGLVVGALGGRLVPAVHHQSAQARPASPAPGLPVSAPASNTSDEAFLVELDAALVSRGATPLTALDALTPEFERAPAGR